MRRSHWVTNLMVKMLPLVLIRVPMILALDAEPIRRPWALVTQVSETQEDIVIRVLDRSGDKKGSLITNINDFKRAPHFCGRVWWMADPRFNQLHSRNKIRVPIGFGTWGRTWQCSNILISNYESFLDKVNMSSAWEILCVCDIFPTISLFMEAFFHWIIQPKLWSKRVN